MSYELSVVDKDGQKTIMFANKGGKFVEVVFTIDGKDAKEGKIPDNTTRGYAYPPKLQKAVTKMKNGKSLFFSKSGEVAAYIFEGQGSYKDEDLEKPAFLRHLLVDKVQFKRTDDNPIVILKVKY